MSGSGADERVSPRLLRDEIEGIDLPAAEALGVLEDEFFDSASSGQMAFFSSPQLEANTGTGVSGIRITRLCAIVLAGSLPTSDISHRNSP